MARIRRIDQARKQDPHARYSVSSISDLGPSEQLEIYFEMRDYPALQRRFRDAWINYFMADGRYEQIEEAARLEASISGEGERLETSVLNYLRENNLEEMRGCTRALIAATLTGDYTSLQSDPQMRYWFEDGPVGQKQLKPLRIRLAERLSEASLNALLDHESFAPYQQGIPENTQEGMESPGTRLQRIKNYRPDSVGAENAVAPAPFEDRHREEQTRAYHLRQAREGYKDLYTTVKGRPIVLESLGDNTRYDLGRLIAGVTGFLVGKDNFVDVYDSLTREQGDEMILTFSLSLGDIRVAEKIDLTIKEVKRLLGTEQGNYLFGEEQQKVVGLTKSLNSIQY